MCEHQHDTRTKVERLIDAMDRLSEALERQQLKDAGYKLIIAGDTHSQWPDPSTKKM